MLGKLKSRAAASNAGPQENSQENDGAVGGSAGFFNNISIGQKILAIVGVVLLALIAVAGTAIVQMDKIGREIAEIAQEDIPLTQAVTKIEIHQLEQAINFERALRYGEEAASGANDHAAENYKKAREKFEALAAKVDKEIVEGEEKADHGIKFAHTAASKAEMEKVLTALKKIEKQHELYDAQALEVLNMIEAGAVAEAITKAEEVEAVEESLAHALEELLVEIGQFTAESALSAEEHEKSALTLLIILSLASAVVSVVLAFFLSQRMIARPLQAVVGGLDALAEGDTSVTLDIKSHDEVGNVARAYEIFKERTIKMKQMEEERQEAERRAQAEKEEADRRVQEERKQAMHDLADNLEAKVGGVIQTVTSASSQMKATAESMSATADETSQRATAVAAASEEASTNVQTVASATEEMSSSVDEIGRQVTQSTEIAGKAVTEAQRTNETVQGLAEAAQKIGEVVNLISDIAEQTNLLALNATIEAARAGDAGKGFAVVASEVKSLANQTAKATEEIAAQIGSMQSVTGEAVQAIESIGSTIGQISEIATAISAAVEEQGAATQEIARNVQEASRGTSEVSSNITSVNQAATETGTSAKEVFTASSQLASESEILRNEISAFLEHARAS